MKYQEAASVLRQGITDNRKKFRDKLLFIHMKGITFVQ